MKPSKGHLDKVKSSWKLNGDLAFVRKVENWIYTSKADKVFVRMTEPGHRSQKLVESELDWMDHLKNQGVRFAHPMKSVSQTYVETIVLDGSTFFVSVFREAEGKLLTEPADFTQKRMENWGRIIGQMHAATKSYSRPALVSPRAQWSEDRNYLCPKKAVKKSDGKLFHRFEKLDAWLRALPQNADSYGLVHADLHHGNFFVNERDEITVFDFDDSHYHWFSYDIAVPIFSLTWHLKRRGSALKWEELGDSFWKGYLSANALSDKWIESVTRFIEYRYFVIYYWILENLNSANLDEKSREFLPKYLAYCKEEMEKLR